MNGDDESTEELEPASDTSESSSVAAPTMRKGFRAMKKKEGLRDTRKRGSTRRKHKRE